MISPTYGQIRWLAVLKSNSALGQEQIMTAMQLLPSSFSSLWTRTDHLTIKQGNEMKEHHEADWILPVTTSKFFTFSHISSFGASEKWSERNESGASDWNWETGLLFSVLWWYMGGSDKGADGWANCSLAEYSKAGADGWAMSDWTGHCKIGENGLLAMTWSSKVAFVLCSVESL